MKFNNVVYVILGMMIALFAHGFASDGVVSIGFLGIKPPDAMDPEASAAYQWLATDPAIKPGYIQFQQIKDRPKSLTPFTVLWWHYPDDSTFTGMMSDPVVKKAMLKFLASGGKLLLTLNAIPYLCELGLEPIPPAVQFIEIKDEGYGRQRGFHSFRGHPVFDGLFNGAFIWNPIVDQRCKQIGYFDSDWPGNGQVIGVDRAYITISESTRLLLEYPVGTGQVLAIGAYTYFQPRNLNRPHLERFMKNCLGYLAGQQSPVPVSHWDRVAPIVSADEISAQLQTFSGGEIWDKGQPVLQLGPATATPGYWDLAGQRLFLIGKETAGIEEIWVHPFMAIRDLQAGIQFSETDSIKWLEQYPARVIVRPEALIRAYTIDSGQLEEIITVSMDQPAAVIHYEYQGQQPIRLSIKMRSNLRRMWPFSEKSNGSMQYDWLENLQSLVLQNRDQDFYCLLGANAACVNPIVGQFDDFTSVNGQIRAIPSDLIQVSALLQYPLDRQPLDIVLSASNSNFNEAQTVYRRTLEKPADIFLKSQDFFHQLLQQHLTLTTPDENFNQGYRWALVGTDRFMAQTPGPGSGLLAGYGTSISGWRGGHTISGRPGYAWYFGRDAQWSALAMLDYGDFARVKTQLTFFRQFQDITGKIFHELSTSGVVHYDAADATPGYILLAGYYLRCSGDLDFIRQSWFSIKKALDFCFSTDTDGDLLIENTNVGHGWIEGGSLYGAHTTLFLASLWYEALRQAAYIARHLNYTDLAGDYEHKSTRVKEIINSQFYNSQSNFYYYGLLKDRSFNPEPTVLAAVPLYFGLAEEQRALLMLNHFARNEFSADWGVRILSEKSPKFNPRGYHYGSIWPLFTGWTALAEYRYGNHLQGFAHVMANLNIYRHWAQGYIEEVLHGALYQPSGVCRHQCWSETMVLQPTLEGMLGLSADALSHQLRFAPAWPADWDSVMVRNIRLGAHELDCKMTRQGGKTRYDFVHRGPAPLQVSFAPALAQGTVIQAIRVNGQPQSASQKHGRQFLALDLDLAIDDSASVAVDHTGGIAALPIVALPQPGDSSRGFRIISTSWSDPQYHIQVQGHAGRKEVLSVFCPDQKIASVENGQILKQENAIYRIQVEFTGSEKYQEKRVTLKIR